MSTVCLHKSHIYSLRLMAASAAGGSSLVKHKEYKSVPEQMFITTTFAC